MCDSLPLAFMGDPHGDFSALRSLSADAGCEALILLGDLDLARPLEEAVAASPWPVWWIPGNHEFDGVLRYDCAFGSALAERNLHGRVAEIAGVRVAGLGGVFLHHRVWDPRRPDGVRHCTREAYLATCGRGNRWRGGLPLGARKAIWPEDVARLAMEEADVLVCHEAPSCHRHGHAVIDELAEVMGVRLVVHGHHHEHYHARICGGRVAVLGVGLGEIRAADGRLLAAPTR